MKLDNKILVVGDCHVSDDQDLSRFDVLSKFIVDKRPSHIVFIGDFMTLNCLSAWDMNKRKKMENRRYMKEIEAGNEALDRAFKDLNKLQAKQKKQKSKVYNPVIYFLEGNHEDRLTRYLDSDPTFEGFVGVEKDLGLEQRGIKWIDYRDYVYIGGIGFTHIPFGKAKEISGIDITRKAQMVMVDSCVFGHTHEQHMSNVHKQGMEHLQQTYNCGCFFEEHEDYVKGRMTNYWKGVTLLHNWQESRFDVESYALSRLEDMYG